MNHIRWFSRVLFEDGVSKPSRNVVAFVLGTVLAVVSAVTLTGCQAGERASERINVGAADTSGTFDGEWVGKRHADGGNCVSDVTMFVQISQGAVQVQMPSYSLGVLRGRVDRNGAIEFEGTLANNHVYRYSGQYANGKFDGNWAVITSFCSGTAWYLRRKDAS